MGVEVERVKHYTDWVFKHHIFPHFEMEEKFLFPILGNKNNLVKKAISQHRRLCRLFNNPDDIHKSISLIEEELEIHIRFEERVLFNEIQKAASEEQLQLISKLHSNERFKDNTEDEFWK